MRLACLIKKATLRRPPTVLRERSFQVLLAQPKWSRSLVVRDANALSKGLNPLFFSNTNGLEPSAGLGIARHVHMQDLKLTYLYFTFYL